MPQLDYDLAIVGGGIIGNTLAVALQNSGLRVVSIESQAQSISIAKSRAYVLSMLSGQIFEGLGVWEEVLPQIAQFSQIQISDADYAGVVKMYPQDLGRSTLGYAASHEVLLTALQNKLRSAANITVMCPAQVVEVKYTPTGAEITIQTPDTETPTKIRTSLVIAADGAKSSLRERAGIATAGWNYWQSCITATVTPAQPHQNVAYERFWYAGPIGVLPLADGRCQVVWTVPHQQAEELRDLPESEFLARLEHCTGGLLGKLELDSQRWLFPVKLMQSKNYIADRLALIGDAAHCCHPVAGQGMNLGIRDAAALAEILVAAHQSGEDIGSKAVLQKYANWRKPENWVILAFTDFLDRMFSTSLLPIVIIRRFGLFLLDRIPGFKYLALRLMTGLAGKIPQVAKFN
ncbi:2-octaprenyl-6-methoxyphenyl hydroxylase [Chamaesiphon polymorphus CCALA 037]|uniref:2-octaprenyl-6-methoxyphenyl hydroxylase n=1 Tax=Chamaesiphon polymorphus CCALA 037 TaxID=2107692 RepID=A0A2T1G636_9CYAN|nr:2-octaprenyl-6-methoxyphenyl hydroxylase [Chamaesiphon polymorphus CCALA 037]